MKLTEQEYLMFYKLIQAMMGRLQNSDLNVYGKAYQHLKNASSSLDKIPD